MFHVPESGRLRMGPMGSSAAQDGNNGAFYFESPEPGWQLIVIASDGEDWEHVSVRAHNGKRGRTPTWREMCWIKDQFWDDEDECVQYHPKRSAYVNCHQDVLHIWRPIGQALLVPPTDLVGPR